ncbi:hypothetical protein OL548_19540 [Lysinibacillus sp. MHQ-1]|nr:hypothetical protein OL548_19540 [Lysinibacillus sp. MHQ-1]
MNCEVIVFKREPDNVPIIDLSSLQLTNKDYKVVTEDVALLFFVAAESILGCFIMEWSNSYRIMSS